MADNKHGPGFVYLLMRHDGWFRIGRTAHPIERFRQWRWMAKNNRYKLTPLLLVNVTNQYEAEKTMHQAFDGTRTYQRQLGYGVRHEWFKIMSAKTVR